MAGNLATLDPAVGSVWRTTLAGAWARARSEPSEEQDPTLSKASNPLDAGRALLEKKHPGTACATAPRIPPNTHDAKVARAKYPATVRPSGTAAGRAPTSRRAGSYTAKPVPGKLGALLMDRSPSHRVRVAVVNYSPTRGMDSLHFRLDFTWPTLAPFATLLPAGHTYTHRAGLPLGVRAVDAPEKRRARNVLRERHTTHSCLTSSH
ncbi:uncharacterized protein JN550_013455 [Neoarthrinium moseri]|uniref:uncharacterized protein n=1 Tax=Neoarthrinium moseri TaxID=1658444 RepID=UPI001FDDBA58|nr:uncharacterized protein JN550_013455 [Neoarthrinium moseri]KAI1857059.1 hypothetical protein JN550_013455 [Neoarthrinium moseri]